MNELRVRPARRTGPVRDGAALEPIEYARALRRRLGLIIRIVVIGLVAAWLTSAFWFFSTKGLQFS